MCGAGAKSAAQRQSAVPGGAGRGWRCSVGILQKTSKPPFWAGREEPDDLGGSFQPGQPQSWRRTGKGTLVCVHVCSWGLRHVGRWEGGRGGQCRIVLAVDLGRGCSQPACWADSPGGSGRQPEPRRPSSRPDCHTCAVQLEEMLGPPDDLVQQLGKARTPPAGPFLGPGSAAHSWSGQEQGPLH